LPEGKTKKKKQEGIDYLKNEEYVSGTSSKGAKEKFQELREKNATEKDRKEKLFLKKEKLPKKRRSRQKKAL